MITLSCDALLFDLDGVLVVSNHVYEANWAVWAKERHVTPGNILEVHRGRLAAETVRLVTPSPIPVVESEA